MRFFVPPHLFPLPPVPLTPLAPPPLLPRSGPEDVCSGARGPCAAGKKRLLLAGSGVGRVGVQGHAPRSGGHHAPRRRHHAPETYAAISPGLPVSVGVTER